ncbi:hypothetical protein BDZ89DRAFT_1078079 [Hymenopellis radicata]|nr:hypothetical protein BDZ89DRAFT_1078079 [Hymenopellis radicata]
MSVHMKGRGAMTIMKDDRTFSLDLVGAVGIFVHKMNDLRWTSADFFEDPEGKMLLHAIARYHA